MRNRIQQPVISMQIAGSVPVDTMYRYKGTIAGHFVAGEMMLPKEPWSARAGMLVLFRELHDNSGLDFEAMEKDNSVEWEQV